MKILVTGGLGFIGSHTVVELQNAGYEVVIIDDLSNASEDVLDGIEAITGTRPEFEKLDLAHRINTLAMIAPITNEEKQKLLEAISLENKVNTLESIIGFYLHETGGNNQTIQ